jgi:A/G-specific adenine glycosylase
MPRKSLENLEEAFLKHLARYGWGPSAVRKFQDLVYQNYMYNGRTLPWRKSCDPYHVLVSEIMLQQTQVDRVISKYVEFISVFPCFDALAAASMQDILKVWQGMGYNRRALYLKRIADTVVDSCNGTLPRSPEELVKLPGIGKATAASIAAFAFNQPVIFIETNIRSVFIHYFFNDRSNIPDDELLPYLEKTLDRTNPRKWYNALMDLGTRLKAKHGNPSRRSKHYQVQSRFEGSRRQLRGKIIKALTRKQRLSRCALASRTGIPVDQLQEIITELEKEGFLHCTKSTIQLK